MTTMDPVVSGSDLQRDRRQTTKVEKHTLEAIPARACCAMPSGRASPISASGRSLDRKTEGDGEIRAAAQEGTESRPCYKRVDTCAAEFESFTPYLYSTYEEEDEAAPTDEEENHHSGQRAQPHRAGN